MAALPCLLFLLIGSAANSQFTLLPQIGFEQSRTTVEYNEEDEFKPISTQGNLKASLRADYRFKKQNIYQRQSKFITCFNEKD